MEKVVLLLGLALAHLNTGRLYWWRKSWAPAPVVLSCNNAQASDVEMTLYLSVETGVTDGVLEVTLPQGFAVSGLSGSVVRVTGQTYLAGEDYQVVLSGLTNPSTAGPYGPVSLRTRSSATSQTLDANLLFAAVYIEVPPSPLVLQVVLSGAASTNVINRSGNTLAFKTQLKVPLRRYDVFELDISPQWTVGQTPQCLSAPAPGQINYYNGSDPSNPRLLACTVTAPAPNQSQTVYVYGLVVDLPEVASSVQLLISPVTTPSVAYFPSMFVWTLSTLRSGSSTVLETGSYSNGPIVAPDTLKVATWKPTWGLEPAYIQAGMTLYMDLSFVTENAIPQGGHVTIVVTEDVCALSWGQGNDPSELPGVSCYIVTFLSVTAACQTSSRSTITLSNLPAIPAHFTFQVRNLVSVVSSAGTTAQILSINTYDQNSINIDTGSNLQPFQISTGSTSRLATGFSLLSTGAKAGDWGNASTYLSFQVCPYSAPTQFASTSEVTVTCPLSSAPSDFAIYIPTTGRVKKWVAGTNLALGVNFNSAGNPAFGSDVTIVNNLIRWQAGSMMSGAAVITFGVLSTGPVYVTMPLVASNQATAYECSMRIQDVATSLKATQVFVSQFQVLAQSWDPGLKFALVCSNNIAGAPAFVTFSPLLVGVRQDSGKTYVLEIGFPIGTAVGLTAAGLGSGLNSGDPYPCATAPNSPNATAKLVFTATRNYVQVYGIGPVSPASTLRIFFPMGGVVVGAGLTATIRSYYQLATDPTSRYISLEGTSAYATTSTASSPFTVITATGNSAKVGADGVQLNLTLKQATSISSTQWVYIVLPNGYRWTNRRKVTMGGGALFPATYFFSSPSDSFPSAGVLLQTSVPGVYVDWLSVSTVHIYGYHLPPSLPSRTAYLTVAIGAADGLETSVCLHTSFKDVPMLATAGAVTGLRVSPSTVRSRGPDSVDITHTVSFSLEHGLQAGGFIVAVLNGNWATTPCTTCWTEGLADMSDSQPVTCTFVGNTVTITQFGDFSLVSQQKVDLTVAHLLPPQSTSGYDFLTSLTTRTSTTAGYQVVDQYQVTSALRVSVQAGGAIGTPVWLNKQLYPDAAGVKADLYLQFQLPHGVPQCGTVRLTATGGWAANPGDVKDACYFTVQYESCIISGVELQLTLSTAAAPGTTYELYLDSALQSPTPNTPIQSVLILSSYWFTETLDADSSTLASVQQAASFNPLMPSSIVVRFQPSLTANGVLGNYFLSLTDSQDLVSGHQLRVQFPSDFDYFLGDVTQSVTGTYPFPCASPQLPALNCTVSHSQLRLTVPTLWPAHTLLNVTFYGVRNPYVSRTGYFAVWHLDANMRCVSAAFNVLFLTLSTAPTKVDIRRVDLSNRGRGQLTNATFLFYLYGNVTANSSLRLTFPSDYDLNQPQYVCNVSINASQTVSTCSAANNSLTLWLGASNQVYTAQLLLSLTVFNLSNPLWGWPRVALAPGTDFDAWDFRTFPSSSFWTQKFSIQVLSSASEVMQSSYANLNAGYSGFTAPGRTLLVNGATLGLLDSPITVMPGTQTTDLLLSTASSDQPCEAKRLVLTPNTSALNLSSQYDHFTLTQGFWSAHFRISADINMLPGKYIVDWGVVETLQSGINTAQYAAPLSSLVVVQKGAPVVVSIAAIPDVWPGSTTPPLRVYLPNSPHTQLNVHLYVVGAPRGLRVQPPVLTYFPGDNQRYFLLNVTSRYVQTDPVSVKSLVISLSGADASAFACPSSVPFHVVSNSSWPSATLTLVSVSVTTTSAVLTLTASVPGTLYWWLGTMGSTWPSFTALHSSTPSLLSAPPTDPKQIQAQVLERMETDPTFRETWSGFQRRLYRAHMSSVWTGAVALSNLSTTLNFTWLWAETAYSVVVFLDPITANSPRPSVQVNFTTLPCPPPQPIRVKFQGSLAPVFSTKIASLLAKQLGVHPQRLYNGTFTLSASRVLQSGVYSSFVYTLLPNRFAPDPTPVVQARLIGAAYSAFQADIQSELGIPNPLVSVTSDDLPTRHAEIEWTQPPQPLSSTNSSVSLYLRASVPGTVCCVALNTTAPSPTQVFMGLDSGNCPSPQGCITTNISNATNTLQVQGLDSGRYYFVFCIATDTYPLWATLMAAEHMAKVQVLTLTYNATQQQDLSEGWTAALSALVGVVLF